MKKESQYLLQIGSAVLLLALWLQIPFLLYSLNRSLHYRMAATFNVWNGAFGIFAFALLFSEARLVFKLALACSTLLGLIYGLTLVTFARTGQSLPWTMAIPFWANVWVSGILWLLALGLKFKRPSLGGKARKLSIPIALIFLAVMTSGVLIEWSCRTWSSCIWSEASDWRWYTLKVQRNELKFRGSSLTTEAPGAVRVLILGDSFTLGYKVNQDKIFTERLAAEWVPPPKLAVFNGSQVNWSIHEERNLYDHLKDSWPPQIVVVAHVLNDIDPDPLPPPMPLWKLWAIYNLYAYRFIRPWMEQASGRHFVTDTLAAYDPKSRNWADYFQQLEALRNDLEARGGHLGVMIFPWIVDLQHYPFERIHTDLHQQLDQMQIPYVDLLDSFRPYPASELAVTRTDVHPSALAHELAAQQLIVFLRHRLLAPRSPIRKG